MAQQDAQLTFGDYQGRMHSWVVLNRPHYVCWARTQPNPDAGLISLIAFADSAAGQAIPTVTNLADINNSRMRIGELKGRTFAWITYHCPAKIDWIRTLVPHCSTEFFRLCQYASYDGTAETDARWTALRITHIAWMRLREERAAARRQN